MKLQTLGRHVLIEYYDCDHDILASHVLIEKYMNEAAIIAGATVVDSVFHHFNPYGVSGAVIIAESHISIHTWPEYGYASVDVYTCGDEVNPWKAFDYLEVQFKANRSESIEIPRGMTEKIRKFTKKELGDITVKNGISK